jgi:archaetidylinositol phosphate synthase
MSTMHEPAHDRVFGPLTAPSGRMLAGALPAGVLALAGVAAAGGAFAAFLADQNVLAGVLVLLAGLLDTTGATRQSGGFGRVLDGVADRYADTLLLAGMAVWSHRHEDWPGPLAVGFAALIGAVALSYMTARVQASAGRDAAIHLFAWTGRDVRILVAAAGAISGQVYWALVLLAVLTHVPVVWALARLRGLMRDA